MDKFEINGDIADVTRLEKMHEKRMNFLFNIRGFVFAADVAWIVLTAPFLRTLKEYGFLEQLLIGASLLLSVLTLILLACSFRKDIRQTGELFVEMYKQLITRGSLENGIAAASKCWYEELSCAAWPWCFAGTIMLFLVAIIWPTVKHLLKCLN